MSDYGMRVDPEQVPSSLAEPSMEAAQPALCRRCVVKAKSGAQALPPASWWQRWRNRRRP